MIHHIPHGSRGHDRHVPDNPRRNTTHPAGLVLGLVAHRRVRAGPLPGRSRSQRVAFAFVFPVSRRWPLSTRILVLAPSEPPSAPAALPWCCRHLPCRTRRHDRVRAVALVVRRARLASTSACSSCCRRAIHSCSSVAPLERLRAVGRGRTVVRGVRTRGVRPLHHWLRSRGRRSEMLTLLKMAHAPPRMGSTTPSGAGRARQPDRRAWSRPRPPSRQRAHDVR